MKKFIIKFSILAIVIIAISSVVLFGLKGNPDAYFLAWGKKVDAVKNPNRDNAVILIGGSNLAFGMNSPLLEDSLKMQVINTSIHAGIGMKAMMDEFCKYAKAGDIVVLAPEYGHPYGTWVGQEALSQLFSIYPYIWKDFNGLQWKTVISEIPSSLSMKKDYYKYRLAHKKPKWNPYALSSFNDNGDVVAHWDKPKETFPHNKPADEDKFSEKYFTYLARQVKELQNRGVKVIIVPPVIEKTSFIAVQRNVKRIEETYKKYNLRQECPSEVFAFADSLNYNTSYHFGKQGADKRTLLLVPIIKKYIGK
ncbi:MAG: hypothetical protein IJ759_00955 [Bacteroidales bacterium]|nr:hypothetical protein [Bacteroidales bacterium]